MSDSNQDVKFSLKVMINKEKTKVLFAEADNSFTDVLLSFLTLPLGKIVRVLEQHYGGDTPVIGSLTTLYHGLSNLDSSHFWTEGGKQMLLDPRSSSGEVCNKLKLDINDTKPVSYFTCENVICCYTRRANIGMYYGTVKCNCGKTLNKEISVENVPQAADQVNDCGIFTISTATFIISDDLKILPNVSASVRQIVSDFGLSNLDGTELRNVTFGLNEIMDLLKGSVLSPIPLTDIILEKQSTFVPTLSFIPIEKNDENETSSSLSHVHLKLIFQKSTNKILFAEAEEGFVEFLFSLLNIPLGGVESLLGNNTCLKNIDNLFRSVVCSLDERYLSVVEKTRLINPTLAHGYASQNKIFPLVEEIAPVLYYYSKNLSNGEYLDPWGHEEQTNCTFKSQRVDELFVKGPRQYMVKDDLTVTPFCMTSYLSTLSDQKIPLSDVGELVVHVGLEEAKRILKASLTLTCALSDGLGHLLQRQPNQEQTGRLNGCFDFVIV